MFGLNPWGHHLTSVLLHALNAVLVFAVAATDDRRDVAEPVGGGVVRGSPAARRIGRLGRGTQGCAQRLLRSALRSGLTCATRSQQSQQGQDPESEVQVDTRHATRSTQHATRITLHVSRPVFLRPVALLFALGLMCKPMLVTLPVRPVAAGLLAAGENVRMQCSITRHHAVTAPLLGAWCWRSSRSLPSRRRRAS